MAVSLLGASWAIMLWRGTPEWLLGLLAALVVALAVFVITRPRPTTSR